MNEIELGGPTKYRVALLLAFVAAVLCLVPMQQIIRDQDDEVSNSSSKDVEAFDRYLAELSQYGASGQEILVSLSLVWKYVHKVGVVATFSVLWPDEI